jgi:selenocysteine lyase/cysteine desulfurase
MRDRILGLDVKVRLDDGRKVPAINLDCAATTPPFIEVADEITEKLKYYGSIGRGKGQKSEMSSLVYEKGRDTVKKFVGANHKKYTVFYVNSTTDGINKLASALITSHRDIVLTTRMEHHANDLPWRERCRTVYADVDGNGRLKIEDIEKLLKHYDGKIKIVAVTAASNVTGYVNEVHKIAKLAHAYGAKIVVDGAQIVAHRAFSMLGRKGENEDIDYFVFAAHKMYSPYGGGAVVGLKAELDNHIPVFYGGGMVEAVTDNDVDFGDTPDLYETGSPNYPGVVGMLKAIQILQEVGFDYIEQHEQDLLKRAIIGLCEAVPGIILYGDCDYENGGIEDRVGILTFNIKTIENEEVADKLAGYAAIAVRHAKFCSHTYVDRLLGLVDTGRMGGCISHKGMVRISFGIFTTGQDIDDFVSAVEALLRPDHVMAFAEGEDMAVKPRHRLPNDRG